MTFGGTAFVEHSMLEFSINGIAYNAQTEDKADKGESVKIPQIVLHLSLGDTAGKDCPRSNIRLDASNYAQNVAIIENKRHKSKGQGSQIVEINYDTDGILTALKHLAEKKNSSTRFVIVVLNFDPAVTESSPIWNWLRIIRETSILYNIEWHLCLDLITFFQARSGQYGTDWEAWCKSVDDKSFVLSGKDKSDCTQAVHPLHLPAEVDPKLMQSWWDQFDEPNKEILRSIVRHPNRRQIDVGILGLIGICQWCGGDHETWRLFSPRFFQYIYFYQTNLGRVRQNIRQQHFLDATRNVVLGVADTLKRNQVTVIRGIILTIFIFAAGLSFFGIWSLYSIVLIVAAITVFRIPGWRLTRMQSHAVSRAPNGDGRYLLWLGLLAITFLITVWLTYFYLFGMEVVRNTVPKDDYSFTVALIHPKWLNRGDFGEIAIFVRCFGKTNGSRCETDFGQLEVVIDGLGGSEPSARIPVEFDNNSQQVLIINPPLDWGGDSEYVAKATIRSLLQDDQPAPQFSCSSESRDQILVSVKTADTSPVVTSKIELLPQAIPFLGKCIDNLFHPTFLRGYLDPFALLIIAILTEFVLISLLEPTVKSVWGIFEQWLRQDSER